MATVNQLKRKPRVSKGYRSNVKRLDKCPQRMGRVTKVVEVAPKKPNSAKRKVAKITLTNHKKILGYIYGIGHNLQPHSNVLVRGGRCQDLIGVRFRPIRGVADFAPVRNRTTRRSKYGIKLKI